MVRNGDFASKSCNLYLGTMSITLKTTTKTVTKTTTKMSTKTTIKKTTKSNFFGGGGVTIFSFWLLPFFCFDDPYSPHTLWGWAVSCMLDFGNLLGDTDALCYKESHFKTKLKPVCWQCNACWNFHLVNFSHFFESVCKFCSAINYAGVFSTRAVNYFQSPFYTAYVTALTAL